MLLQKRIHEWSKGQPAWQRDLLRRLAQGPLIGTDHEEVLGILLGLRGAPTPTPVELKDLPADEEEHGQVELRAIRDVRNVNSLAEGQQLSFAPGLNVIFGKNATGKTGYGRLLRAVCRAADREDILPNVFGASSPGPQSATIAIAVDDEESELAIDLSRSTPRILSAINVFDAGCARVYLTKPNIVDYVPRALTLLKELAVAQTELAEELRAKIDALEAALPTLPDLDPDTEAGEALENLDETTDPKQLKRFDLSTDEAAELAGLRRASAAIQADNSAELEAAARARAAAAVNVRETIREAATLVKPEALTKIASVRSTWEGAIRAERDLAARAFGDQRFPCTGDDAWQEMWQAAVRFVEAGGGVFPSGESDAACPLCQQDLERPARDRLAAFEEFVQGDLRDRVLRLERELAHLGRQLPDPTVLRATVEGLLSGLPEEIASAARTAVDEVERRVKRARALADGTTNNRTKVQEIVLDELDVYAADEARVAERHAGLRDEAKQRATLRRLAELEARRTVVEAVPKITNYVKALQKTKEYEAAAKQLGTQAISLQLKKLQEAVVTERLRSAIAEELEAMHLIGDRVEVIGRASKGEAAIQLRLRRADAKVETVLSRGEQAALATAFFLAELRVSNTRSSIVLDDPVSSFDHDHYEYLANRLVEEAKKGRQVVIYTHDLGFLYYLQRSAEREKIELQGQTLERVADDVGVVRDSLPVKAVSPARRRRELRRVLNFELEPLFKGGKPEYEHQADLWVIELRRAYEQLIEEYVLAGVVRRWNMNVRVRDLHKVKWTPDIAGRIERAMKQLAPKAHYEATEIYPRSFDLDKLQALFKEFEALCDATAPKEDNAAEMNKTLLAQAEAAKLSQAS